MPPEDHSIRKASSEDTATIIRLVNAAFNVESFLEGTRTDEKNMADMKLRGDFFLLHNREGKLISSIFIELRGERGYFGMLAVDPEEQGKGFGKKMIDFAENYCRERGCNVMDLKILSPRTELPPFYEKLGYRNMGRDEFKPSRPVKQDVECHLILMSKAL